MPRVAESSGIDIDLLRAFVSVCELRSLTKAAAHLQVTQAAVSQRMLQLERIVRIRLLDRALRPIEVTPAGQELLGRAREALAALRRLEVDLSRGAGAPLPSFRVGVTDSFGTWLLPDLVPQLRPFSERLLVRVDSSVSISAALMNRSLDVIVSNDPLEEADELLERFELFREPMVVVCSTKEPLPGKDVYVNLKWLSINRPLIRFSAVSPLARQVETHLRQVGVSPPHALEFNSAEAIVQMVRDRLGWTITTPSNLLLSRVDLSHFRMSKLSRGTTSRSTWLLARKGELGNVARDIAVMAVRVLHERVVPRIAAELPWAMADTKIAIRAVGTDSRKDDRRHKAIV